MKPLVIYHGGCRDGFCAAWVLHEATGGRADFHEGFYGQDPPDVADRNVIMVDFCYPREIMERLAKAATSLEVLDHHKTAQAALEGFVADGAHVVFDMGRSGAGLAWDEYFDIDRPWPVAYVEDRDLWRHALPHAKEVSAFLGTVPFEFDAWTNLQEMPLERAIEAGRYVEAKTRQYIREVAKNAVRAHFHGYDVPMVNAPQVDISELLNFLSHGEPFSMGWFQRGDGRYQYSLRSKGDFDVSEIAKAHGGGGHKNAAGFQLDKPLELVWSVKP